MATRTIAIADDQADLIDKLVESGKYRDETEVVRDALHLIEMREIEKTKLKALRDAAQVAIDQIEAGQFRDFDSAEELDAYLHSLVQDALSESHERGAAT